MANQLQLNDLTSDQVYELICGIASGEESNINDYEEELDNYETPEEKKAILL